MNYYPFHIGDYASATRHLSWDEDAAYRRLLDLYYTTEKPIPLDERAVFRLLIAITDSQREAVKTVLGEFFAKTEKGWINARADAEIEVMKAKQEAQREKAKKRWQKPAPDCGNASNNAVALKNDAADDASAMPRHTNNDATALKNDAEAMLPTPTPTPTPIIKPTHTNARAPDGSVGWVEKWEPDKKHLADQLGFRGVAMPSDAGLEQILYAFRAHYETKPMTDKQSMAKLVAWIQREHKPTNPDKPAGKTNRHAGFEDTDYSAGVLPDGRF